MAERGVAQGALLDVRSVLGEGLFESVKVEGGRPFALGRHLRRLSRSAVRLGLPEPNEAVVRDAVEQVLAGRDLPLGRVRITWAAGTEGPVLDVVAAPVRPWTRPAAVVTVPGARNEHSPLAGLKTTAYADNALALARAVAAGADEAVLGNFAGGLCEGTGTNVFYVLDGELRTPSEESGCLPGVTRELLLEWVDVRVADEPLAVLEGASEIFLTSSTRDVQPVRRCDGRELGAPGPVAAEVARTWAERAGADPDP